MPMTYIGELAGLATAVFFAGGASFFTLSSRLVGSQVVNRTRLLVATLILLGLHLLLYGSLVPDASRERWIWLGLSGVIGLALGDAALFQAFVQLGTRLTMLVFSTAPVVAAIFGYFLFDETLNAVQILGMLLGLGGVLWVVSEPDGQPRSQSQQRVYLFGLLFAFLAALGQALGAITAKYGLEGDFPALSAQVLRMLTATTSIWLFTLLRGQAASTFGTLRQQPKAFGLLLIGALFGPVSGVWLSLVSIQNTEVGIASTLIAMVPIFLLPIGYFVFKEKLTVRGIIGTVVALAGVAILFLA
ncbi:MAG: DMT family transporter [Anaerolineales bacterium]|nr:MAG: DMT family transporter [Anaerolineales bacterium]